jgi:hypothetical protein
MRVGVRIMDIQFFIVVAIVFFGGILKALLGWINAVKPDGSREPWDWRMFFGSMINVFIAAVIWTGANFISGQVNLASYVGAFGAGIASDNIIHEVQKVVAPAKSPPAVNQEAPGSKT